MTNTPAVFIDMTCETHLLELRQYFKTLGADISTDIYSVDPEDPKKKIVDVSANMLDIIRVCDACFNHASELEIESILNGIVSILVSFHGEVPKAAILAFSEKISQAKLGNVALRVLWLLFQGVSDELPLRYNVYYHLVQISIETDQVRAIFPGLDTFKKWFSKAPPKTEEMQRLLRLLHKALIQCKESELAAKVMIELLGTYTSENAAAAREDAERCILAAIADPETFLLDPLLSLKPVRVLEKELVYELLLIFISKKLSDYLQFYNKNKDFISKMGLDHEANQKKMRLLTAMQLAEGVSEISFDTITSELQIDESQVEAFVIDLLKTKLVRGRMDQSARKVHVSSTMHRTFGPAQWEQLRQTLRAWKASLATVQEGMTQVVHAQLEMASQRTKVL